MFHSIDQNSQEKEKNLSKLNSYNLSDKYKSIYQHDREAQKHIIHHIHDEVLCNYLTDGTSMYNDQNWNFQLQYYINITPQQISIFSLYIFSFYSFFFLCSEFISIVHVLTSYGILGRWHEYLRLRCEARACCRAKSTLAPPRNNDSYN